MRSAAKFILYAQLSLFGFLLLCVFLIPHFLFEANEGGVSNYGTYAKTVIPYTLGLGLCGVFTICASFSVPKEAGRHLLRRALYVLGALYLLELLSTYFYKRSDVFNDIHVYISMAGAVYGTVLSTWLALSVARNTLNNMLLLTQFAGFTAAALTYFEHWNIIFIAESLTTVAFGAILVRAANEFF
jgi:hypothetical protein